MGPGLIASGKELVLACNRLGVLIDLSYLNERGFYDVTELSDPPLVASHSNSHTLCPINRNLTDGQLDAIRASNGAVGVNFAVHFCRQDGWRESNTPLEVVVRHFEDLCERMGCDHVAFGSDFDGTVVPNDLRDVEGLPRLVSALHSAGFQDADLQKIALGNWMGILKATWTPRTER